MSESIAMVIRVFDDDTAEVMTDRKNACGGCEDSHGCRTCLSGGDKLVAVVRNDPHAQAGDLVVVEHSRGALWGSAALFYLLPIVGLMAGAFAGGGLAGRWGLDNTSGAIVAALIGLGLGMLIVVLVSRSRYAGSRLVPRIVRIAEHRPDEGSRDWAVPSKVSGQSCCGGRSPL